MAAWNFPLVLLALPAIGALGAGNLVVLKPSELSPHTGALYEDLVPKYFYDTKAVAVLNGKTLDDSKRVLNERYDFISFTGGPGGGKAVYQAAAKNLTPVTLELGGKSPVIVDERADIDFTAKRILWGKVKNAGQVCLAPDYILVPSSVHDKLITSLKKHIKAMQPEGAEKDLAYSHIISEGHFKRITTLLSQTKGKIEHGGANKPANRFIEPTFVSGVDASDSLMSEEIFGPILPIVKAESIDDAIAYVNARDKPLALYVFSDDKATQQKIINGTSSGAVVINDVVTHFAITGLPFGGVGNSGFGYYGGKHGFDQFSNLKGVAKVPKFIEGALKARYGPATPLTEGAALAKLNRRLPFNEKEGSADRKGHGIFFYLTFLALGGAAAYQYNQSRL